MSKYSTRFVVFIVQYSNLTRLCERKDISKVQDDEVGDGTTSVCILAAELLREAEKLVNQKIHPQTIIEGYRLASKAALDALDGFAVDNRFALVTNVFGGMLTDWQYSKDTVAFQKDLLNIAKTTLSSKVLSQYKDYFGQLAVDAVLRLKVCYVYCSLFV